MTEKLANTPQPPEILRIMLERDNFSRWLGLVVDEYREGFCKLHYQVKDEMLNGLGVIHGGVLFSAADSAFAFACNSHGNVTLAMEVSINFTRSARPGEWLYVTAEEIYLGNKTGVYDIRTINEKGELVAIFKGTAYRTSRPIE